jgi:hypothetical protein
MNSLTELGAGLQLPADLIEHHKALDESVAKAKRMRAAVDETAAAIPTLEAEAKRLDEQIGEKDADLSVAMVDDERKVKILDVELKKLAGELASKQQALHRSRNIIKVLESRAPEQDEVVQQAVIVLENDLLRFGDSMMDQIRAELLEQVKPLQGVFAAIRALAPVGDSNVRELIQAAHVPDPSDCRRIQGPGVGAMTFGTNLLALEPEPEYRARAEAISATLAPIRTSIVAAKALGNYLPLDRRPKPYVRRGYTMDGEATRAARAKEAAEAERAAAEAQRPGFKRSINSGGSLVDDAKAAEQRKPGFRARVREGYADQPPPGTAIDGEMGHQRVNALLHSTKDGSAFAV